jgi:hypothetical protein
METAHMLLTSITDLQHVGGFHGRLQQHYCLKCSEAENGFVNNIPSSICNHIYQYYITKLSVDSSGTTNNCYLPTYLNAYNGIYSLSCTRLRPKFGTIFYYETTFIIFLCCFNIKVMGVLIQQRSKLILTIIKFIEINRIYKWFNQFHYPFHMFELHGPSGGL